MRSSKYFLRRGSDKLNLSGAPIKAFDLVNKDHTGYRKADG